MYCQIDLVMRIGLASKIPILIVELAKHHREEELPIQDAATKADRMPMRPILMTALAFVWVWSQ